MAEKGKDFSNYGYPDERFEKELSDCHNLHCAICSNVFKDPVMCRNEHCFCRACITEHLKNSQDCPCCNQHLSLESLTDAPRILRNLLSELKIRRDYHERGCEEFVRLGNLASHVATCTKAPVVSAKEKCSSEISEDQARHEECRLMMQEIEAYLGGLCDQVGKLNTIVNEQRSELKTGLTKMGNRFGEVESRFGKRENRFEKVENQLKDMENKIDQLDKRFENAENQFLQMGNLSSRDERRESMLDMKSTRSDQATQADLVRDIEDEKNPLEYTYIVAGGYGEENQLLKSVEVFDKTRNSLTRLPSLKKVRAEASLVVYKGQLLVTGGTSDGEGTLSSIEQFTRNINPFALPYWSNFTVNLPRVLKGHCTVVYNDRLLVIGGYDEENKPSHVIYEIQLCFLFNTKVLTTIPLPRPITNCGIVLVDDKIFIFEGSAIVTMHDITKNEFKELAPLAYEVCDMATVKYGENVIHAGGSNGRRSDKNTVISYSIETQKSVMLPPMQYRRSACQAVVDNKSRVVMEGEIWSGNLKSVQTFDFRSFKWRDFHSMNVERKGVFAGIV